MKRCDEVKLTWELPLLRQPILMHVRNIIVLADMDHGPSIDSAVGPKSSSLDSPCSTTTLQFFQILKKTNLMYTIIAITLLLQSNFNFYFICYQNQISNVIGE